jgi:hypothetical protein
MSQYEGMQLEVWFLRYRFILGMHFRTLLPRKRVP